MEADKVGATLVQLNASLRRENMRSTNSRNKSSYVQVVTAQNICRALRGFVHGLLG